MITRTFTTPDGVERIAEFSDCLNYRISLLIRWDRTLPVQMLIGLNPSKADERRNDPTVLRGIDYCHRWNKGGLLMANAFAFRATDPRIQSVMTIRQNIWSISRSMWPAEPPSPVGARKLRT